MRCVDVLGEHDPVRRAVGAVAVGHDEQRPTVVAPEHAREAATVNVDGVEDFATFSDTGASLTGNAGIPDRPLDVAADAIRGRARSEVSPDAPVNELTRVPDRPRGQRLASPAGGREDP